MLRYLIRKSAGWLAMIVVAANLTYFLATAFLDPRSNYLQLRPVPPPEQVARSLEQYNLNPETPLLERWWTWLTSIVLHWDWGRSPIGDSVNAQVAFRIGVSAQLVVLGLTLAAVVGVALGVYTATRQYSLADRFQQGLSVFTLNVPLVVGALAVVLVAISINQTLGTTVLFVAGANSPSVSGFWPTVVDRLQHLALPTVTLVLFSYAGYHLLQRNLLLDDVNSDYVRTARAKGLTRTQAVRRHALRTTLIPVATSVAFAIPALFTGAVITETIFAWQGMGQYMIQSIAKNDVHAVVAVAVFGAAMTALGAILADIAVVVLDPRVRLT
ncbi:MAG: ABC transporter permease [Pseudonocardia sp.]